MENGMHVEIPLPVGVMVESFEDDTGRWFTVNSPTHGKIGPRNTFLGEWYVGTTDHDEVFAALAYAGVEQDEAQQIVDHLTEQGLVI